MIEKSCITLKVLEPGALGQTHGANGESSVFTLRLESPGWKEWRPGQFVMIRPESPQSNLLWGRALSIGDFDDQALTLYVQKAGRGTEELSLLRPGDQVTVWGPLGNLFSVEEKSKTFILAGGIGIAPFVGYCRKHPNPQNVRLLFSHRQPADLYPVETVARHIGADSIEDFHDQKPGDLDRFMRLLENRIQACRPEDLLLCCGPNPFMRSVRDLALRAGLRLQVSLENRMVCGIGACLGCVAREKHKDGYIQTCSHGPVFWAHKIEI